MDQNAGLSVASDEGSDEINNNAIVVIAGSDFQAGSSSDKDRHEQGAAAVSAILTQIAKDYPTADGFLFAGDYDKGYNQNIEGHAALQETVQSFYGTAMHEVYIEGNHDSNSSQDMTGVLSKSGANDAADYGVFVINESDYMWYNDNESRIKQTASNLKTYLDGKLADEYEKPIFVISHLGLNFNYRTREEGFAKNAKYIFDVLNDAGAEGLNIIFLFGHTHSEGRDDDLGGSSTFLHKGDSIYIAKAGNKKEYTVETLNFTYMNAGYVAYYKTDNSGAETCTTMTAFEITEDTVKVSRYSANGIHQLKAKGVKNEKWKDYSDVVALEPNTTVYESPQIIELEKFVEKVEKTDGGITVAAPNLTGLTVTKAENPEYDHEAYTAYALYDITPEGYTQGDAAKVTITLDEADGFDASMPVVVLDGGEVLTKTNIVDGKVTFTTKHFSGYAVAQVAEVLYTYEQVMSLDEIVSGAHYVIVSEEGAMGKYGANDSAVTEVMRSISKDDWDYDDALFGSQAATIDSNGCLSSEEALTEWVFTKNDDGTYTITSADGTRTLGYKADEKWLEDGSENTKFILAEGTKDNHFVMKNEYNNGKYYIAYRYDSGDNRRNPWSQRNQSGSNPTDIRLFKVSGTADPGWKLVVAPNNGTTTYTYTQVTSITANNKYVIVDGETAVALMGDLSAQKATISGTTLTSTTALTEWSFSGTDGKINISNGSSKLKVHGDKIELKNEDNKAAIRTAENNPGYFEIHKGDDNADNNGWLYYDGSKWTAHKKTTELVRLYQYSSQATSGGTAALYAKLEIKGELNYEVSMDTSADTVWADILEDVTAYTNSSASDEGRTELADSALTWDMSSYDPNTPGTYTVAIKYNNVTLGTATVTVLERTAASISVSPKSFTVERDTPASTEIGTVTAVFTNEDGTETTETFPLTLGMLSGNLNLSKNGTYRDLSVNWLGASDGGITVTVTNKSGVDDFPEYPNPGSVNLTKTAEPLDQNTGLTRVELSTSGLPSTKGVDVVIVVDMSSSMDKEITITGEDGKTTTVSRIKVLSDSLKNMLLQFQQENTTTHTVPDIDIAIIGFNGYYTGKSATDYDNIAIDGDGRENEDQGQIYTGDNAGKEIKEVTLSAADFVKNTQIDAATVAGYFKEDNTHSGTNYDSGLENAYKLLAAKQAANTEARDQFVIFLSDGGPFRYNGFNQDDDSDYADAYGNDLGWDDWLMGAWADETAFKDAFPNSTDVQSYYAFYNGNGTSHPHRYAEAIKGKTSENFDVVTADASATGYMTQVKGLNAKVYSIGFCLANDNTLTPEHAAAVIKNLSSGEGYYEENVTDPDQLDATFSRIASAISYAATNAVFEDQMGDSFNLQLKTSHVNSSNETITVDNHIDISVSNVYTAADVEAGICEEEQVGKPYGENTVIETVTFNADGTAAYSSVDGYTLPNGTTVVAAVYDDKGNLTNADTATNILAPIETEETDGLADGVIYAKNFYYNTTTATKTVNGVTIEPETFVWNIGTVNQKQYTMSYMVYLDGSMTGLPAGSYATNNYATLTYVNWAGNEVSESVPSPNVGWKAAQVSYAFYLVDSEGNPLDANGDRAANFLTAYKISQPIVADDILLNDQLGTVLELDTVDTSGLPEGYVIYDNAATYKVVANSGTGGGSWTITKSADKVESTYVTGFAGANDYSKALNSKDGDGYSYFNTTVYFAVVWNIGTVDDTVVIDYGIPVDISVLANDMLGSSGTLMGVGAYTDETSDDEHDGAFGDKYISSYGTVTVNGSKVRYTPNSMEMPSYDRFSYEAQYQTSDKQTTQYYYGTVTVIPATTIYYEDDFLQLNQGNTSGTRSDWEQTDGSDLTQGEDRPGEFDLPSIDANNIYGYDGAYTNCSTHSLDGMAKVHVDANSYATASFSFYGTGFDVISVTSNATGSLLIRVYNEAGTRVANKLVDTFYGMEENGDLSVNTPDTLYQVPVMKISGLTYGKYSVEITATYNNTMDHTEDEEDGYDLYLDAIRIYDPTGVAAGGTDNKVVNDAYLADGEAWPVYQELRNNIIAASGYEVEENKDGSVTVSGDDLSGAIFIDCNDETTSIADYVSFGPKNEVYLAPGQAVAFNLDQTNANYFADVQIGLKSATGGAVTYKIYNAGENAAANANEHTLTTSTDMYYSIKSLANGTIVIENTEESAGILSITNIKITHTEAPEAVANLLRMDSRSAGMALMSLRRMPVVEDEVPEATEPEATEPEVTEPEATEPEATEPEVTEPEVTEPEATEPELFEPVTFTVKMKKTSVEQGKDAEVEIRTGADVARITVNGKEITDKKTDKKSGEIVWKIKIKGETVGTLAIEIIAFNADGVAAEPVNQTIEVTAAGAKNEPGKKEPAKGKGK